MRRMIQLAYPINTAHAGGGRPFQAIQQPSGETLEPSLPCGFSEERRPFFVENGENGLAHSARGGKLYIGSRKPLSRSGSIPITLNPYCLGQECDGYARTVLRHGCPVKKSGPQMGLSSSWPRPTDENPGSRKPVHLEALVANLSARGGVSLPRLTLPRLSYSGGRLAWEFRCGHTAPVAKPFPKGLTVADAARQASCPACAHLEALVARRRPVQEVAHV